MPSDTYNLTISEDGVSIPSAHASSHLTAGSDPIQLATIAQEGLMSAAHAIELAAASALVAFGVSGTGAVVRTTNAVLITPNLGTPSAITLTNGTGLPIVAGTTGTLTVARGGTGTSTSTGSGNVVLHNSPTLTTPNLGTPASGTLTNCSGLPLASGVTGTLTVSNGGTGATTLTGILKGNGAGAFTAVTAPTGDIVGTTDTQTLSGKSISGSVNTITNVSLTSGVTGTLPVANGGSGATTLTGILKGNGTGAFTAVTAPSGTIVGTTDTQTLTGKTISGASNTITNVSLTTGVTGVLPVANGGTGFAAPSRGLVSTGSTGFTWVTAGTSNTFIPVLGGTPTLSADSGMTLGLTVNAYALRNTSGATRTYLVTASLSASPSATDDIGIALAAGVAGALTEITASRMYSHATINDPVNLHTTAIVTLAANEEVCIYAADQGAASTTLTFDNVVLVATAIL